MITNLILAWGHIWGHIELLQEVLSMSRMHSIEVDIGGWVIGCGTQEPPFWKARSNLNFQVHIWRRPLVTRNGQRVFSYDLSDLMVVPSGTSVTCQ